MAWSWSHTAEAYENACENVHNRDRAWLEVVYAEWHACQSPSEDSEEFNQRKYNTALRRAKKLPTDVLADYIWERMSEYATCTNGGYEAYACPYGCHLVSFDHEETIDAEVEAAFAED